MTLRPIGKTDEDIEDVVAALLAAGNGLDVTYDDENGTLTVDVSQNAIGTGELSFETATQDELDAVESSAADARTDLRFALYPEEVDASTRDSYYQNFAKFADSAAMTSIAASSVVMDEVSESETAMDAVSTSATAMDAVSASLIARTAAFHSDYSVSSLWASSPGAKTILESGGSPTLPKTYDDPKSSRSGTTIRIEDGTDISLPGNATSALEIEVTDSDDQYRRGLTLDLDLSDASTLEFMDRGDGLDSSKIKHGVEVGGETLISKAGNNGWTTRTVDVSSFNGTQPVLFFTDTGTFSGEDWEHYFSRIYLY